MDSHAFNLQVRRLGVERSRKGVDSDIRVTEKVPSATRERQCLTAAGHLLMKQRVSDDEHDRIMLRMLEKESPITEIEVVEKSPLNKDKVAQDLFKDSPEALHGYRQAQLAQEILSTGAKLASSSLLKKKDKNKPHKKAGGKEKADRFLGETPGSSTPVSPGPPAPLNAQQAQDSEAEAAGGGGFWPLVVRSPLNYVM
jgi:hypothetical protein